MLNVYEEPSYRNKRHVFTDRYNAGELLARFLQPHLHGLSPATVLAIPSGGVPVGLTVSQHLSLDFDLIPVRKVQIPGNPEAGFGAVALQGQIFFNQSLLRQLRLSQEQIEQQVEKVRSELRERNEAFRAGALLPDLSERTALLVDDGLASGYTMIAAMDTARKQGATKVAVAVPTAPLHSLENISPLADLVFALLVKESGPFAVADAYSNWRDLDSEEVRQMLQQKEH